MKRRNFIALLGGAAAGWPLAARAQQGSRTRRIGVLINLAQSDPAALSFVTAFAQGLQEFGWADGRDVHIEWRWGAGDAALLQKSAAELIAPAPDVILASGDGAALSLQAATRKLPIVFANVGDPIAIGLVESLARPGGNATGFMNFEYGLSAKWLELLKEIAPRLTRAGVLRNPTNPGNSGQVGAIQAAALSMGIDLSQIDARDPDTIERQIAAFARSPNGGLIITAGPQAPALRELFIAVAARYRLPAIYPFRYYATGGGLGAYGPDQVGQFRLAAGYVDRILKGDKPAELPVQAPTRYGLVINLKTAKALGIEIPSAVLVRADEVIE
jgi:putative tryptophan/tyrosine transport system substrate-binding protein